MKIPIPMIGNIYGQLTVIDRNMRYSSKNYHWNCLCTCGNVVVYPGTRLRSGEVTRCLTCYRNHKLEQGNKVTSVQLEIGGVEIPLSHTEHKELLSYLASLKAEYRDRLGVLENEYNEKSQDIASILEEKKELDDNIRKIISAEKALNEVMVL